MHVLFLPKWYPGRHDPQVGDFLRKQAIATAAHVRMSVLSVEGVTDPTLDIGDVLNENDDAWELCIRYRASASRAFAWRKLVNFMRYMGAMQRGWKRVHAERGKPDLLHAYILVRPVLFAWWKGRSQGIPFIISEQSSEYLDGTYAGKSAAFKALNHFLFRRAKVITAVSTWLGDALQQQALCKNYEVVPNVIPGLERPLPAAGKPGHFMVVADLVDRTKNVSGVLRALAAARRINADLRLTIIGDGADRRVLEELTTQLNMAACVEFLGRVSNDVVLDNMRTIFAVIINSNVETFSVVTGEALAQGKPVIATRCGGPVAFITPENGLLIATKDDDALAKAMVELTANSVRYDPLTIRKTVSDRFSPAAVGAAFHSIYLKALHHGG